MKRKNVLQLFIVACFILTSSAALAQSKAKKEKEEKNEKAKTPSVKKDTILNGKVFITELFDMNSKKGDKNKFDDVIEFKNNKVTSKYFEKLGFSASEYTVSLDSTNTEERVYVFEAESTNEAEKTTLKWEGTLDGDEFSGSANKFKKEIPKGSFEFKGYEKSKKKK